jgi:hypothetical protein
MSCAAHEGKGHGTRCSPDDAYVLSVVDHAGRWLGAEAVAPGTLTPVAERAEQEGGQSFYVPATCRSVDEVRAMIDEYLSDV